MVQAEKRGDCQQSLEFNNRETRKDVAFHSNQNADRVETLVNVNSETLLTEADTDFDVEHNHAPGANDSSTDQNIVGSDTNESMDEISSDDDQSIHEIHSDLDKSMDEVDSDENEDDDQIDSEEDEDHDEMDSDEDENNRIDDRYREPLYRNAPLTIHESMVLILCFFLRHNVTQTCLSDLIILINLHCLPLNMYKNSLFKFKKYFSLSKKNPILKHFYCTWCFKKLEHCNDSCTSCPRRRKKNVSYFVEVNIISQLKEMFRRPYFYNNLQCRFHLQRGPNEMIDIYDSKLYKTWLLNGFLQNPHNISLTWYTDGVPVYKSSKISMWPIYLVINELPFKMRMKRENMILATIWYGPQKPDFSMFFDCLTSSLTKLKQGISIR